MKCNDTYYNRRTRIRKLFIFERLREGCSLFFGHTRYAEAQADNRPENTGIIKMVGPNGLEPSTSSVSRKRSNQTELQAYTRMAVRSILTGGGYSGNVWCAP